MSWEQPVYSFGTPNAQPPTPSETPTSGHFPSPTFQTPKQNSGFENRSGWTPTFAEEYSVFHSTPGRLTKEQRPFPETPRLALSTQDQRLSTGGDLAAELATHIHHLSPNPNQSLPPVDPSIQLPSSPGIRSGFDDSTTKKVTPRKPKKRLDEAFSGQTATPPASATKGSRKLAPKILTPNMQNVSQDGQFGITDTPTQDHAFMSFSATSADFFAYPMSAPATASGFSASRSFWDPDTSMAGMGLDFTAGNEMFNTDPGSHRAISSFDWGRNNQMFQEGMNMPEGQSGGQKEPDVATKRQRPLAPKVSVPTSQATSMAPFDFNNVQIPDDPFSALSMDGAVDPGLLFSRNTVSMPSEFEDVVLAAQRPASSHVTLEPYQHQMRELRRDREEHLRARNQGDKTKGRTIDRGTVSSPVKGSARPGLQRSISDNLGRRGHDRVISRTGRSSPLKQSKLTSLSSIPESPLLLQRPRTEVKFTIDANGRARTETVLIEEKPRPRRRGPHSNEDWDSSQYDSSSDEEPIIIPSRNTSFTFPEQPKEPNLGRFETSKRGPNLRRHSANASYSQSETSSQHSARLGSAESEAETIMDGEDGSGDAARELRKVMEDRKKKAMRSRRPRHHRLSGEISRGTSSTTYSSSTNISPTTITDPDGATPSSTRSGTTRCVCNRADSEGFMIQCESCDNWLHAQCVNIDQRSLPPVYICAYCANTPNMRGGRIREPARSLASSPLAHKSFKSFR